MNDNNRSGPLGELEDKLAATLEEHSREKAALARALSAAQQELEDIHRSRLWKVGTAYWTMRRSALHVLRRLSPGRLFSRRPGLPGQPGPAEGFTGAGMSFLTGRCNICGEQTAFYYTDPKVFRESLTCRVCLTTSRYRSIARGLLRAVELLAGVRADSLASLTRAPSPSSRLAVYDTQAPFYFRGNAYPIPDLLARCPWIDVQTSLYKPGEPTGRKMGARTTNQNLERLTFPDASFDIVVTSDVMEHVRLDDLAQAEIRRVLRPGGIYLFTVPHFRNRETLVRVRVVDPVDPERDEFLLEPEYHGDANSEGGRALAYRAYGTDLDDRLRALGFAVEYSAQPIEELGIRNTELFFCRLAAGPG